MKPNIWTIPQLGVKDRCWNILNSKLKYSKYSKFHILISVCAQSCLILYHPMDYRACQAPLSMGLSRQSILKWVAVSFSKGIFPTQGWNTYLVPSASACRFFTTAPFGKPIFFLRESIIIFRNFKVRKKVFCIFLCIYHFQSSALNSWRRQWHPHSSTLAWKIPWTEEAGGLQSMGSLESDATERLHFPFSLSCIGEGNGNPLQRSCLESPRDGGAWWAAVYGVAQSRTRLKRLSSSSTYLCSHKYPSGNIFLTPKEFYLIFLECWSTDNEYFQFLCLKRNAIEFFVYFFFNILKYYVTPLYCGSPCCCHFSYLLICVWSLLTLAAFKILWLIFDIFTSDCDMLWCFLHIFSVWPPWTLFGLFLVFVNFGKKLQTWLQIFFSLLFSGIWATCI